jgi:hypothetical protein
MSPTPKYIVIGRFSHERNSWVPNGDIRHVVSGHRRLSAARRAADATQYARGGCDGSDLLSKVMIRAARLGSRKAAEVAGGSHDHYEYAGWIYVEVPFWDDHELTIIPGGFGIRVR